MMVITVFSLLEHHFNINRANFGAEYKQDRTVQECLIWAWMTSKNSFFFLPLVGESCFKHLICFIRLCTDCTLCETVWDTGPIIQNVTNQKCIHMWQIRVIHAASPCVTLATCFSKWHLFLVQFFHIQMKLKVIHFWLIHFERTTQS